MMRKLPLSTPLLGVQGGEAAGGGVRSQLVLIRSVDLPPVPFKMDFPNIERSVGMTRETHERGLVEHVGEKQSQAQAHDAWFKAEVADALREAGDPGVRRIPHAAAMSGLAAHVQRPA